MLWASPTKYADLGIDGEVRLEIRTDRVRNERCTPGSAAGSQLRMPGRLQAAAPRQPGRTCGPAACSAERVHLNVDYDTERDFTANNNIQVYYEGLEDEIVRRVEVGTVSFQPPPLPLHHRRRPDQQLRRQRPVRGRRRAAPDPRRRPRRAVRWPSGPTPSGRPPARRRTARCATSTSRAAGSSGWWTRPAFRAIPRSTS